MADRPVNGLQTAFELAEFGARLVESMFRREHSDATDADVEAAVSSWWSDRPGAPDGDCVGRVVHLPR